MTIGFPHGTNVPFRHPRSVSGIQKKFGQYVDRNTMSRMIDGIRDNLSVKNRPRVIKNKRNFDRFDAAAGALNKRHPP